MEEFVKGDLIEDIKEELEETPWVNIPLNATQEELEEQILTSTLAAMKLKHGDKLHYHVLERMISCDEGSLGHKAWAKILKRIQEEKGGE